jgi:SAM-dependent methyltransferase
MVKKALGIPPPDLRMGYGTDSDESYLRSGQETTNSLRRLVARHGASIADSVLDWGCSTGRVLRHFRDEAEISEFWGADRDERAIRWAKSNLCPPFRFVSVADDPELPFADERFSLVYGISVFTHIGHRVDAWLVELRRIVRKGGHAIFTIHDDHTAGWMLQYGRMPWVPPELDLNEVPERDVMTFSIDSGDWRGEYTFFGDEWIEREWSQYFELLEIRPYAEGYQSAVVLKRT